MRTIESPYIDLCILIPCYNNFDGLIQSINSIIYNSQQLLVLVIDDGSSDHITYERLNRRLIRAVNIKIIRLENNLGITKALNKGLDFIYSDLSVEYIARLDCSDICAPNRFYTQISFFKSNPDVHFIGSWCYFKDPTSGTAYEYITPTHHKQIKRSMNFRNVFIHPTVMWRFSAMGKLKYPQQYCHAEDYGLFYWMVSKVRTAIINEFLVTCEINQNGISISNRSVQLHSRLQVISHFGRNKLLIFMGAIKLRLLMIIPYQVILITKKKLYNAA
jgi:glycosyltransferase involved in cell wall biosynthesis